MGTDLLEDDQKMYDDEFGKMVDSGALGDDPENLPEEQESITPEELASREDGDTSSTSDGDKTPEDEEQDKVDEFANNTTEDGDKKISSKKKGLFAGGAGVLGLVGLGSMLILLPGMKLNSMLDGMETRAYGVVENAVEHRVSRLFEHYIATRVFGLGQRCGTVVDRSCRTTYGNGIAGNLFTGWNDNRIEDRMMDRLGFTVETNTNAGPGDQRHTLRDRHGNEVRLSDGDLRAGGWTDGDSPGSRALGKDIKKFMRKEFKWHEVLKKRSILKLNKRKHKMPYRCYLACNDRDDLDKKVSNLRTRMKARMVERVIYPMSTKYGIYMDCIMKGRDCTPDSLNSQALERMTAEEIDEVLEVFDGNAGKRLGQIVLEKMIGKIFGQTAGRAAAGAVPVAGWVYLGLTVTDLANEVWHGVQNNTLGKYATDLHAKQYLEYYNAIRSANDEVKAGVLSMAEVGALTNEFTGSEQSQIVESLQPRSKISLFSNKAYAAPAEEYKCQNGKGIPEGEYISPEKKVVMSFAFEDWADSETGQLLASLNFYEAGCTEANRGEVAPPHCIRPLVHSALQAISGVGDAAAEQALSGVGTAARAVGLGSYMDSAETFAKEKMGLVSKAIVEKVIPLALKDDSPARDKVDGLIGGSEVEARDFAMGGRSAEGEPYGIGGVALSDQQTAAILQQRQEQDNYNNSTEGYFARITNLENPKSVASQLLMSTPSQPSEFATSIASGFTGLFNGNLFGSLMSAFSTKASADVPGSSIKSPFGLTKYGYPVDDTTADINPDELTPERCEQFKNEREETKTIDPVSGADVYSKTDPCLLEMIATETAGALFTDAYDEAEGSSDTTTPDGGLGISPDGFVFPLKTTKSVIAAGTSQSGTTLKWCTTSLTNCHHHYNAADIFAPEGTPVVAAKDGTVIFAHDRGPGQGSSLAILVDGFVLWYGHLQSGSITARGTVAGKVVRAGDELGAVGNNADADNTAGHVHFDAQPAPPATTRQACASAECTIPPFVFTNVQPVLVPSYNALPD